MSSRERWQRLSVVLLLALGGVALSLVRVAPYTFNADEGQHLLTAAHGLDEARIWWPPHAHPPLSFVAWHLWRAALPASATRLCPALFAVLAVVGLYLAAEALFGAAPALAASAICASAPLLVILAPAVRSHSMLWGFGAVTLACWLRWLDDPGPTLLAGASVALLCAAASHYSAYGLISALAVSGLIHWRRGRLPGRQLATAALAQLPLALMLGVLATHAQFYLTTESIRGALNPYAQGGYGGWRPLVGPARLVRFVTGPYLWPLAGLAAGGWVLVAASRREWTRLSLLAVPLALAVGLNLTGIQPLGGLPRHDAHLLPFVLLMIAGGLAELLSRWPRLAWPGGAALLLALGLSLFADRGFLEPYHRFEWPLRRADLARQLEGLRGSGPVLLDWQSAAVLRSQRGARDADPRWRPTDAWRWDAVCLRRALDAAGGARVRVLQLGWLYDLPRPVGWRVVEQRRIGRSRCVLFARGSR